jgi:hypothetical protein
MAKSKVSSKFKAKPSLLSRVGKAIKGRPKTFLLVLVLIIVLGIGMFPRVQQAFAASCSGSRIDTYSIRGVGSRSGDYAGYIALYWDGYKNCAKAYAGGFTEGDNMYRVLCIRAGSQEKRCDRGYYTYYAGPEWTASGSAGKCIDLWAADYSSYSAYNSGAPKAWREVYNVHCG